MRRTRTCATSLIPSGRHGSTCSCSCTCTFGFDVRGRGREGLTRGRAGEGRGCATFFTFFTFVAAAGRACFCTVDAGVDGFGAASCTDPPAQPAARIGTRIQLATRPVANGYPVNFGFAFAGVAAGAVPPPPPPPPPVVV